MFKNRQIKKYEKKLLPTLVKRYGLQTSYSASQVRATVYQCNFTPTYLPLGYMLYLEPNECKHILSKEFPELKLSQYKLEMADVLTSAHSHGQLSSPALV
jgi:hypothetical protein